MLNNIFGSIIGCSIVRLFYIINHKKEYTGKLVRKILITLIPEIVVVAITLTGVIIYNSLDYGISPYYNYYKVDMSDKEIVCNLEISDKSSESNIRKIDTTILTDEHAKLQKRQL